MAHQVESGVYNVERGLPWHKLGEAHEGFQTASEILCAAGLDWQVHKEPMFLNADGVLGTQVPDSFAVVRESDGSALGVVGNRYVPAQNIDVLSLMDNVIGPGQAAYDTAWSLRGGKTVAITAELGERKPIAEGEEMRTFLTATNNHDGSGKIRYIVSPVRVVCMNTLAMALNGAKFTWERKHTANAMSPESINEAREALALAGEYQNYIERTARELLGENFTKDDFYNLASKVVFGQAYGDIMRLGEDEQPSTYSKNRFDELMAVYTNSPNLENIRNTKWGSLNAIAEWSDYSGSYRGENKDDNRVESILMGRGVDTKTRALELLKAA